MATKNEILVAIRKVAKKIGRSPSRHIFHRTTGISEYQVLTYYESWRLAVKAAGIKPNNGPIPIDPAVLLQDWGKMVRRERRIPTSAWYRREGKFNPSIFERKFGCWMAIPVHFREFAKTRPAWADVVALLPNTPDLVKSSVPRPAEPIIDKTSPVKMVKILKYDRIPTFGNPIDFRGLRHEPVNEQGVVFLFGMLARELGYLVEAVQTGFPDCEAKRQVGGGKWKRARIEFEFESKNFKEHGHNPEGCEVIVCWRHNWPQCPKHIEVVELKDVIRIIKKAEG